MANRRTVVGGFIATIFALFSRTRSSAEEHSGVVEPIDEAAVIASIGYKVVTVAAENAFAEWQKLREASEGYPVIVGDTRSLASIADNISFSRARVSEEGWSPESVIEAASMLRFPGAMYEKREEELKRFNDAYPDLPNSGPFEPDIGEWPAQASAAPGLTVHQDYRGKLLDRVYIVILPTDNGYEAPAYFAWGGWNDNPKPEYHVAALRSWQQRYGTELVGLSGAVLNLRSQRKPADREEALELAREHYAYCADIVDQGVGSLSELAASYLESDWWYFWWD